MVFHNLATSNARLITTLTHTLTVPELANIFLPPWSHVGTHHVRRQESVLVRMQVASTEHSIMPPFKRRAAALKRSVAPSKRSRANEEEELDEDHAIANSDDDGSSGGDDSFPDNSDDDGDESDEDQDDEDQDDDGTDAKEIQVEFEFFDPEEKDFLGLKALLSSYLNGDQFDSSAFINAIIDEGDVGSVVKTDEDDDPIAVMAVLNTTQYKDSAFMKQIRDFLVAKCPSSAADSKASLIKAWDSLGTGLLVNERLINAPPKLGPPLMQFIMHEIQDRAQQGGPDAKHFQYKRYLLATRVYIDSSVAREAGNSHAQKDAEAGSSKQHKKANQQAKPSQPGGQLVFVRPEDEFLHQQCAWAFTFPVDGRPVTKDGLVAHRLVMQVDADRVDAARADLDRVVGNMAAGMQAGEGQQGAGEPAAAAASGARAQEAGPSSSSAPDVERMAAEMFATAAAAGAGPGAAQRGKQKKKNRAKAVTL